MTWLNIHVFALTMLTVLLAGDVVAQGENFTIDTVKIGGGMFCKKTVVDDQAQITQEVYYKTGANSGLATYYYYDNGSDSKWVGYLLDDQRVGLWTVSIKQKKNKWVIVGETVYGENTQIVSALSWDLSKKVKYAQYCDPEGGNCIYLKYDHKGALLYMGDVMLLEVQ
jgi:hypothetical protein